MSVVFSFIVSCAKQQKLSQQIVFFFEEGGHAPVEIEGALTIIKDRFDNYGCANDIKYDATTKLYTLSLPEEADPTMAKKLLTTKGKVELWESWNFNFKDIFTPTDSVFRYAMKTRDQNPTFIVHVNDTSKVKDILETCRESRSDWPKDLSFRWGANPIDKKGEMFELYLIHSVIYPQEPILSNSHIRKAYSDEVSGNWSIQIQLNDIGAERFEKATGRNVGKMLPIVIDDEVYGAPVVNTAITGGRLEIAGGFTKAAAEEYALMFRFKSLPLKTILK